LNFEGWYNLGFAYFWTKMLREAKSSVMNKLLAKLNF
jgi:hypothetical protein